jgi:hypothetical protein
MTRRRCGVAVFTASITTTNAPTNWPVAPTVTGLEQRMLALAEQLGPIALTAQAKTVGWTDGDALKSDPLVCVMAQRNCGSNSRQTRLPSGEYSRQRREEPEDAVAASSTQRGRNVVRPCSPIPGRTARTVRRPQCAARKTMGKTSRLMASAAARAPVPARAVSRAPRRAAPRARMPAS